MVGLIDCNARDSGAPSESHDRRMAR